MLPLTLSRLWTISRNVFNEILRERVLYVTALFALSLAVAILILGQVSAGTQDKISLDVGMAGISLFGLMIAAFVGGGLLNKEVEKRTILVMLAKPISRAEFIIGKHLGLSAVLLVLVALMTLILFILMSLNQFAYPAGPLIVTALYIVLQLSLLTAAALLFGSFTSSLIATLLTVALYFMGHFSQNLVRLGQRIESEGVRQLLQLLYLIFPDLSRLDLKNTAVYGMLPSPLELGVNAFYGVIYTVALLAIATLIFSRRNF
ncbi:MAG: ABC transporter permease subunit [Thermosynechococcus sp. Uc]|uniref:ABC transporter permease n=1 Tax=Thermosynechococcus sp. Uc TaxID=3034853 RepID=UPI0019FC18FF|nr:ABC transporter permease subunit [Thermosynechococcus sp. Uc]MDM7326393.1 ABC transporter permease subunit [Thermosynechococcus sp. Uc]HIK25644.1 ABC transporter permease subunit [Thermosynechococcus sp. M46_R2017_013]